MSRSLFRLAPLTLLAGLGVGASAAAAPLGSSPPGSENILLLVADDLGVDVLGTYPEAVNAPPTPNIDALAQSGVTFRTAYSNPVCSTTRATLQTGRYSFRTGVGSIVQNNPNLPYYYALQPAETTLAEMLEIGTGGQYSHTAIGKWHLGNDSVGGALAPNLAGYSHFSGILFNVPYQSGTANPYSHWQKVEDGSTFLSSRYTATDKVDEAATWLATVSEPWLLVVNFNLPHAPFHRPPAALHSYSLPKSRPDPGDDARPYYEAMIEAMDTEIGRLLSYVDLGATHVIFLGDNGTPQEVTRAPFDPAHAKSTVYEGGIRVPLIVSGPAVVAPNRVADGLVNTTDVFATVAELAGVDLQALSLPMLDSKSLVPYLHNPGQPSRRRFVYAETFSPNGATDPSHWERAVRNSRYKLIRRRDAGGPVEEELYDLASDPLETTPIDPAQLDALGARHYWAVRTRMRMLGGLK